MAYSSSILIAFCLILLTFILLFQALEVLLLYIVKPLNIKVPFVKPEGFTMRNRGQSPRQSKGCRSIAVWKSVRPGDFGTAFQADVGEAYHIFRGRCPPVTHSIGLQPYHGSMYLMS